MPQFLEFNVNLETFLDELKALIKSHEKRIEELLAQESKSFANFVKPLEDMDDALSLLFTPLSHLNSVCNTKETQDIYAACLPILTEYSTKLSQNLEVYKAYKAIEEIEKNSLNHEQQRVLKLNIQNFELSGAHLDEEKKARLQEINLRKSELTNNFSQNLLDATSAYEKIITNPEDVAGIPESDLESAKFEEEGVTKYRFTLHMPSYIAYMTYGPNRAIREELYKAYTTRAPQNEEIIGELLALRDEMSKILGFSSYADYSLASKMAKSKEQVVEFLQKLLDHSLAQAHTELAEVQKLSNEPLASYDSAFYSEILKIQAYDFDEELFRPYFEQHSVVKGMFEFLHKLFGIEFREVSLQLWHEKAKAYDLYINNELQARLYLDLEARKEKKGGAWMHNWQTHATDSHAKKSLAAVFIVCNFPTSTATSPSLLRHDDVVTLFHEMGHALHHMLSHVNESEVSGVHGVEWDAVEFPSQFLENFAYEPAVLKLFAKHHKSGEILPDEMIEKLVRSKNFQSALAMVRQLEFSLFDFLLHSKLHSKDEVQPLLDSIRERTALIKPPSYNKFQNGFSHIFSGGYAAGYYSYKWAEVLSADAFMRVVDEGIFESQTAKEYLNIVLRGGGSKSMAEFFEELMHQEPNPMNLLRFNGIAE